MRGAEWDEEEKPRYRVWAARCWSAECHASVYVLCFLAHLRDFSLLSGKQPGDVKSKVGLDVT